jgi:hypothetical protein
MVIGTIDSQVTGIKRESCDSSLGDLFGYTADDVEVEKQIKVVSENKIVLALKEYERFLPLSLEERKVNPIKSILNPSEISAFLSIVPQYAGVDNYYLRTTLVLSQLIQNSYSAGHNNFNLNFDEFPSMDSYVRITANEDRTAKIKVDGNANGFLCAYSSNVIVFVNGNVGSNFAFHGKNINAVIKGDVGDSFCSESNDVNAFVGGGYDGIIFGGQNNTIYMGIETIRYRTSECNLISGLEARNDPLFKQKIAELKEAFKR